MPRWHRVAFAGKTDPWPIHHRPIGIGVGAGHLDRWPRSVGMAGAWYSAGFHHSISEPPLELNVLRILGIGFQLFA